MSFVKSLLVKLGIRKRENPNSVEGLRARGVTVGENVYLYESNIDYGHGFLITIGNRVTITGAQILAHDASLQHAFGVSKVGKVVIGDDVFIGRGAIILPNVHIGNRVVIGAGAIVSRDVPDNSIVAGNPAKIIGTYDDFVEKNRKLMETRPVYNTFWADKTQEEKEKMKRELDDGLGFDK